MMKKAWKIGVNSQARRLNGLSGTAGASGIAAGGSVGVAVGPGVAPGAGEAAGKHGRRRAAGPTTPRRTGPSQAGEPPAPGHDVGRQGTGS